MADERKTPDVVDAAGAHKFPVALRDRIAALTDSMTVDPDAKIDGEGAITKEDCENDAKLVRKMRDTDRY